MILASLIGCFNTLKVPNIDLNVYIKLPKYGIAFEELINVFDFKFLIRMITMVFPSEEHMLYNFKCILIEMLFQ